MQLMRFPAVGDLNDPNDIAGVQSQFRFTWDPLGRLQTVWVDVLKGVVPDPNMYVGYEYDAVGALDKILYSNGVTADFDYDELNRLISLNYKDSSQTKIAEYLYDLYADGLRRQVTELDGTTTQWEYDDINRLTKEIYDTTGTTNDYTHQYKYDLVGNRRYKINGGVTTTYNYNNLDQLISEITGGTTTTYGYNPNGAMTSKSVGGSVTNYLYNLQQRMIRVSDGSGVLAEYHYNPDGMRDRKVWDGGAKTTEFLVEPFNPTGYAQILKETTDGQLSPTDPNEFHEEMTFLLGLSVLGQTQSNAVDPNVLFYIADGHGSVRFLMWLNNQANNGQLADEAYHFDAFGNLLPHATQNPIARHLYVREYFDPHLGGYDNRERWYLPTLGRMNRRDTFSGFADEPVSLHKYLYANSDPINNSDPTGLFSVAEFATVNAIRIIITEFDGDVYFYSEFSVQATLTGLTVEQAIVYAAAGVGAGYALTGAFKALSRIVRRSFNRLVNKVGLEVGQELAEQVVRRNAVHFEGRLLRGVSDDIEKVWNKSAKTNGAKELIGEIGASYTGYAMGYENVLFTKNGSGHGIDQIMRKGDDWLIVEAKGGHKSDLSHGQMSQRWITKKLKALRRTDKALVDQIIDARKQGRVKGMVVRTRPSGNNAFTPSHVIKDWEDIGPQTWSGRGQGPQ